MLGGTFKARGELVLATADWDGEVDFQGVDPGGLHSSLAGTLSGKARLKGVLTPTPRTLAVLDLKLRRRRRDWLPPVVAAKGTVHLGTRIIDLAGVTLSGQGHRVEARGSVNLSSRRVNLYLVEP